MDHPSLQQQTTITTNTFPSGNGGILGGDDCPKDPANTIIIKGKRTKRHRQQSSIPFTIVTHSSTSYNTFNSSPASSNDFSTRSTTTEDEDTANCLILLSKGHNIPATNNNNIEEFSNYKFNSKRYIQTSTDDSDEITGMYVYECKTCSRTFPSFQALGGHRASHKKPRINEKPPRYATTTTFSEEDEPSPPSPQFLSKKNISSASSSLSLQFNDKAYSNTKKLSSKLHECSICGTEFTSGQALGGHMRRHRATNPNTTTNTNINTNTNTNTTLSLVPYTPVTTTMVVDDQDNQKSRNDGLCLDLDLNLPAPPETALVVVDQHLESSFKFMANQNKQQPGVHLSITPTLVDCHY